MQFAVGKKGVAGLLLRAIQCRASIADVVMPKILFVTYML